MILAVHEKNGHCGAAQVVSSDKPRSGIGVFSPHLARIAVLRQAGAPEEIVETVPDFRQCFINELEEIRACSDGAPGAFGNQIIRYAHRLDAIVVGDLAILFDSVDEALGGDAVDFRLDGGRVEGLERLVCVVEVIGPAHVEKAAHNVAKVSGAKSLAPRCTTTSMGR